jgi:hypothetical protein
MGTVCNFVLLCSEPGLAIKMFAFFRSDHFANPTNYDFTSNHVRWSHDLSRVMICSLLTAITHLICSKYLLRPMARRLVIPDQRMVGVDRKKLIQHLEFKHAKFISSGWKLVSYGKPDGSDV